MTETLLSILCGEEHWDWDPNNANTIRFKPDGTGELICRHELNIWIGAEFEWKAQQASALSEAIDPSSSSSSVASTETAHVLRRFDVDLTLLKRRVLRFQTPEMQSRQLNESLLTDAAFQTKTYTLTLEQGNFLTPYDAMAPDEEDQYTPRFALRLAFDKSPYPPRQEWKNPDGAPDAMKMWEWKEFCGRQLPPGSGAQGSKSSAWGNCVVS